MGLSHYQLKTAKLADLIVAAQSDEHDDSPAMNEIIRRFDGKARQIAAAVCLRRADRDDVADVALLALVRAVRRHDAVRQGFATYAVAFMNGAARRESKRLACPSETFFGSTDLTVTIDSPQWYHLADSTAAQQDWGSGHIDKIIASLPQRQQQLLDERYVQDFDLARIAQTHGSSVSAVSQRLRTVHKQIIRKMQPTRPSAVAA